MGPLSLFFLCLLVVWTVGIGVGLRIGWMLWRREKPEKNWTYVRPDNVIVLTAAEAIRRGQVVTTDGRPAA